MVITVGASSFDLRARILPPYADAEASLPAIFALRAIKKSRLKYGVRWSFKYIWLLDFCSGNTSSTIRLFFTRTLFSSICLCLMLCMLTMMTLLLLTAYDVKLCRIISTPRDLAIAMTISLVLEFAIVFAGTPEIQMLVRICSCFSVSISACNCSILMVLLSVALATVSMRSFVALIFVTVSSLCAVIFALISHISSLLAHFSIMLKRSLIVGSLVGVSIALLSSMVSWVTVCDGNGESDIG